MLALIETRKRTDEQIESCGIERLQGAVELQRRPALLAIHDIGESPRASSSLYHYEKATNVVEYQDLPSSGVNSGREA
jgi:hypothetical protein